MIYIAEGNRFSGLDQMKFWPARSGDGKADIPPEKQAQNPEAWIPHAHGHQVGAGGTEPAPQERSAAPDSEAAVEVRRSVRGFVFRAPSG